MPSAPAVITGPVVISPGDWTWLLRIPIAAGQPIPMYWWFNWHAHTLLPMLRAAQEAS